MKLLAYLLLAAALTARSQPTQSDAHDARARDPAAPHQRALETLPAERARAKWSGLLWVFQPVGWPA